MCLKFKLTFSALAFVLVNGCSSYGPDDYAVPYATNKKSSCINTEPAQEMKCKEKEESLLIGLGADKNCNHPYEYEMNRCRKEQAKRQKALDESLKKHTEK